MSPPLEMSPPPTSVRTTCPYCGVGCGLIVSRAADGTATIAGDREHPANFGRLCSKGAALGETLSLDDRLLWPLIHGDPASWDSALSLIAARFSETIKKHGPDSVALYVSGQLLTEDYYVANKLMKGFVGTANIDTNSRLCMASSVAGHKRAFGADTVPGTYEDLELADLVVLTGSNLAWCHPVLYQRLLAAREKRGTKIVVIDPRRTATCEHADLHLPLNSGTDVALFNGLLRHLYVIGGLDHPYIKAHTSGLPFALDVARDFPLEDVACITGLTECDVLAFYDLFATTPRTVTVYSQGVNQSSAGTDKVNAIINCHLATARIGKPGMGPFSVTGQPNAMGGREVGGLATMLAAHMDLDNAAHRKTVQQFWQSPRIADKPGLKAVDLFRAVADGRIKALWIMATNPVDSLPEADMVRAALKACPLVVVSDVTRHTDTTAYAHVLLPSTAWGEKDGTVTNSERRVSRQRAFLPAPGDTRPDWWQLAEVAKRMGFADAFTYAGPSEIFAEHARLSAADNDGARDFDIGTYGAIAADAYDALAPFQWPALQAGRHSQGASRTIPAQAGIRVQLAVPDIPHPTPSPEGEGLEAGTSKPLPLKGGVGVGDVGPRCTSEAASPGRDHRFFGDGRFFHPDGRARLVPTPYRPPATQTSSEFPLLLNTGRARDQWHTMTRTGKSPRLMAQFGEPHVEVHPSDAARHHLTPAGLCTVTTPHGTVLVRTLITERQTPGSLFLPMHWTGQGSASARAGAVMGSALDPVSGQPELKHIPAKVEPFHARWYGFAVTAHRPAPVVLQRWADYWAIARTTAGWRLELAGRTDLKDAQVAATALGISPADESLNYADAASGQKRWAWFDDQRLLAALFVAPSPVGVARDHTAGLLSTPLASPQDRAAVLSGRTPADTPDHGPNVCACLNVGRNQILAALVPGQPATVARVGQATGAGTNCGSCRAEIAGLIAHHADRPVSI